MYAGQRCCLQRGKVVCIDPAAPAQVRPLTHVPKRESSPSTPCADAGGCKSNQVTNDPAGVVQALEPVSMHALLLERSNHAFEHAILLRAMRGNELLTQPVAPHQGCVMVTGNIRPLSDLSRNGSGTAPSVPTRETRACSSALAAVVARPVRDRCQASNSRVWQSMTRASDAQPSCPAQTRHRSVDRRSLGALTADGRA